MKKALLHHAPPLPQKPHALEKCWKKGKGGDGKCFYHISDSTQLPCFGLRPRRGGSGLPRSDLNVNPQIPLNQNARLISGYLVYFERKGDDPSAIVWDGKLFFRIPASTLPEVKKFTPLLFWADTSSRKKNLKGKMGFIDTFEGTFGRFAYPSDDVPSIKGVFSKTKRF